MAHMPSNSSTYEEENAFDGIAPSSDSRSSSHPSYDVFINHRGPDVKKNLASLLYYVLSDVYKLCVFLDNEELRMGDILPRTIQEAIQKASVHIVIFSRHFAESVWCLAELSFMRKIGAKNIIPVFYDLYPFNLRNNIQSGIYVDAFKKHEENGRIAPEILQKWKSDLYEISYLDHGRILKSIVDSALKLVKTEVLETAEYPVGLDDAAHLFRSTTLEQVRAESTKVVGIVGIEGVGKTTLARHLYNQLSSQHDASCFLSDVRQVAAKNGFESLQSRLLKQLVLYDSRIYSTLEGKELLRSRLRGINDLIILDDVDDASQLDALIVKGVVGSDSLVIITSRNKVVLRSSGVSVFHELNGLKEDDAKQLLCWYAFQHPQPRKGYEGLVDHSVVECGGLPSSVKEIGLKLQEKMKWGHLFAQLERGELERKTVAAIEEH
eukprot:Gb_33172 [translate_table: standard]